MTAYKGEYTIEGVTCRKTGHKSLMSIETPIKEEILCNCEKYGSPQVADITKHLSYLIQKAETMQQIPEKLNQIQVEKKTIYSSFCQMPIISQSFTNSISETSQKSLFMIDPEKQINFQQDHGCRRNSFDRNNCLKRPKPNGCNDMLQSNCRPAEAYI